MDQALETIFEKKRLKLLIEIIKQCQFCNLEYDAEPYKGNTSLQLKKKLKINNATMSYHIKKLAKANLIIKKQKGKWIYLFANFETIEKMTDYFSNLFHQPKTKKDRPFIDIFKPSNKLYHKDFKKIISLIENHNFKSFHKTKRQESFVIYLKKLEKDKNDKGQIITKEFYLTTVLNDLTNIVTITNFTSKELNAEFIDLFKKYEKIVPNFSI